MDQLDLRSEATDDESDLMNYIKFQETYGNQQDTQIYPGFCKMLFKRLITDFQSEVINMVEEEFAQLPTDEKFDAETEKELRLKIKMEKEKVSTLEFDIESEMNDIEAEYLAVKEDVMTNEKHVMTIRKEREELLKESFLLSKQVEDYQRKIDTLITLNTDLFKEAHSKEPLKRIEILKGKLAKRDLSSPPPATFFDHLSVEEDLKSLTDKKCESKSFKTYSFDENETKETTDYFEDETTSNASSTQLGDFDKPGLTVHQSRLFNALSRMRQHLTGLFKMPKI